MNYLTAKLVIKERLLYLTVFLKIFLVGYVRTISSANAATAIRVDNGIAPLQMLVLLQ